MPWMENPYGLVPLNWGTNIFRRVSVWSVLNHAYDELQYACHSHRRKMTGLSTLVTLT